MDLGRGDLSAPDERKYTALYIERVSSFFTVGFLLN